MEDAHDAGRPWRSRAEPFDVDELTGRVEELARDPALRVRLGAAGRRRVEETFDARGYAAAIVDRYTARARPRAADPV